jgi:hypothetical protein
VRHVPTRTWTQSRSTGTGFTLFLLSNLRFYFDEYDDRAAAS